MQTALVILLALLSLAGAACAVYFGVVIRRVLLVLARTPRLRDGLTETAEGVGPPTVCVIVPAHNEARVIEKAVHSILAQDYAALRVVFALDRCTDDTRAIVERAGAGDPRVEIVEIDACPAGWAGKTHALREGVARSRAAESTDVLLFLDADTEMSPACVRAAVGLMRARGVDLVSLLGELTRDRWYERVVQPMTSVELMRQHPLYRVNRERDRTSFANGQFLLFRKAAYEALGGHARVKDALLEDLAFARALKADGRPWVVALAGPMLRCRMYGSWEAFGRGWRRIFIESARRRPDRLRRYGRRVRLAYTALPVAALAALVTGAIGVAGDTGAVARVGVVAGSIGLGVWLLAMTLALRAQGAGIGAALLTPIGAWLTGGVLAEAARDLEENRGLVWGGRVYTDLTPGSSTPDD